MAMPPATPCWPRWPPAWPPPLPEGALLARIGGEEFLAVLPDCPPRTARLMAEDLRRAVMSAPISLPQGCARTELGVTISVGVALGRGGRTCRRWTPRRCWPAPTAPCSAPNPPAATASSSRHRKSRHNCRCDTLPRRSRTQALLFFAVGIA
ncbi:GGDEF domain-containing protein [Paracoccus thiocyanatus]|uniref:GGDEF domain-containing protein n=1 Tax=Paracoccus thiocyanatus TaxID=34006 RepID=UPI00286970EA|nr:diguanylate cyclase [Paracoccus thiocyanatus]